MPAKVNRKFSVLAFDRDSVRRKDADGRLHVETAHISAANVCPYYGREIPDWEALGLQPDKIYYLYRDPEELEKAAPTFNNLPILSEHQPVTAESHDPDLVIGTTGDRAEFGNNFLDNSLAFWSKAAIDDIESDQKKQLSSAYRYRADMRPGTSPAGDRYDGVMRDIIGNHVALVREGRAGPDVVVGDEATMPKSKVNRTTRALLGWKRGDRKPIAGDSKEGTMKLRMTPRGLITAGALGAYLQPRLAADARIPVGAVVRDLTRKNLMEKLPQIAAAVRHAARGKLAQDADLEDLDEFLDAIQGEKLEEDAEPEDIDVIRPGEGQQGEEGEDDEPPELLAKIREFLKDHLDEEALAKFDEMVGEAPAEVKEPDAAEDARRRSYDARRAAKDAARKRMGGDETPEEREEHEEEMRRRAAHDRRRAHDEPAHFEGKPELVTKEAMDAAIARAVKDADARATARAAAIREAESVVRPWVGDLHVVFDSAPAVYRGALDALGVDHAGVHESALRKIVEMTPRPDGKRPAPVAQDAATAKSFNTRFPGAARIERV